MRSKTSLNPFPNNKLLDPSKLKEFTDGNFKFDENGQKAVQKGSNTAGKGEIVDKQFLLFPQCFQNTADM